METYVVLYEEQMEHGPDKTVYGLFSSISEAQRWIVKEAQKDLPGEFMVMPLRLVLEKL